MDRSLLKVIVCMIVLLLVTETNFGMSRGPSLAKKQGLISRERLAWEEERAALEKLAKEEAEVEKNYKKELFALRSGDAEEFFERQGRALEALEKEKVAAELNYNNKIDALRQKRSQQVESIGRKQLYNDALTAIYNNSNEPTLSNILFKMKKKCSPQEFINYIFKLSNVADEYNNQIASDLLQRILSE